MAAPYEGGCLCGLVRWRATVEPTNVRICHCRNCQRATGAPFFARAIFPREAFGYSGETTGWRSSQRLERKSCARCGTALFAEPNDPPARIGVSIASCDDRHALRPEAHIWVSEKLDWLRLDDGLPQHPEGFPK